MYWSSEGASVSIVEKIGGLEVRIPLHVAAPCVRDPRCVLVAQLLKYWTQQDGLVTSATEYRQTVDFRRDL
jgi:hypothetical protein